MLSFRANPTSTISCFQAAHSSVQCMLLLLCSCILVAFVTFHVNHVLPDRKTKHPYLNSCCCFCAGTDIPTVHQPGSRPPLWSRVCTYAFCKWPLMSQASGLSVVYAHWHLCRDARKECCNKHSGCLILGGVACTFWACFDLNWSLR